MSRKVKHEPWWNSVPDPDHPRHHEACDPRDCDYAPRESLPELFKNRKNREYAERMRQRRLDQIAEQLARATPAPRSMWPSLAWAWVKGFVKAMSEIKLSDWQKALRKGGVTIKHEGPVPSMIVPDGTKIPVIFVDGEAWTLASAGKTATGPYRENPTNLRRVMPAEAALIASVSAERARRYMMFTISMVAVSVIIQVLRLIFEG